MYKPTHRQIPLLNDELELAEGARRRLAESWAADFEREVLPILLASEDRFALLYSDSNGRPNWSVARKLGLCVLQELQGLTDQEAVDALAFDVRWHRALGLPAREAYLSRRSLVEFRARLVAHDPESSLVYEVFMAVGDRAIERLGLSTSEQRLDSTHIVSNIRTRGRADLFGKTLRNFYSWLARERAELVGQLSESLRQWVAADDVNGWSQGGRNPKADLQTRANWAVEIIRTFESDQSVRQVEAWQLVLRLVREQCEWSDGDGDGGNGDGVGGGDGGGDSDSDSDSSSDADNMASDSAATMEPNVASDSIVSAPAAEQAKLHRSPKGSTLQSPFDPDAGCGHKGSGYHVHVTETCRNKGPEIITDIAVLAAQHADRAQLLPTLDRLSAHGTCPSVCYADGGYSHGGAFIATAAMGVALVSPVTLGALPKDYVGRESFVFNDSGHVTACPEGHAPTRHGPRRSDSSAERVLHAFFDRKLCGDCPLLGRCAARPPNGGKGDYRVELRQELVERDIAYVRQQQPEWRERYSIRAGVEATMSELKRGHGLGRLRVRRLARVRVAVVFKATGCNVKRWLRAA